jgi:phospholipid/cholesterol/gamma-HCH transport system substrate-binding protein
VVIRRMTKVQLMVFALITVLGVSYVSTRYVGLGERLFGDGFVVQADLAESGGIFTGAEVTYRGVQVGRVGALKLAEDGVLVDLKLEGGTEVPRDTAAVVENRSAVGEQYVDLQPRGQDGPFLAGGDRIAREDTATPLPVETLLLDLDRLVRSVDRRDLAVTIDELGKAFSGTGPDLQRMIDSGDALTKEATDALPETIRLIEDGRTVLDTQRETGSAIRSFSRDLRALSATLRDSDGDLRKVLDNGVVASQQLRGVLRDNRPAIGALLANLLTTGQITVARLDGVEQVLATYPVNVAGGYTVVPGDGTSHFGLVTNASDPPVCQRGYGGTDRRSPHATSDTRANTDARCTEPRSSETSVRGAQHAPGPDGGSAAALPGGWAGAEDAVRTSADVSDGAVSSSYLTGYDPASGVARGPGGAPLRIGTRGGQTETFGKDSWQWLLLGPLGR